MKKSFSILLALVMLFSLCACGAKQDSAAVAEPMAAEAPAAAPAEMYTTEEAAYDGAEYGGFAAAGGTVLNSTASQSRSKETAQAQPDKIIYSADVTVETTGFEAAVEQIGKLVKECGGWIESSSINGSNYYNQARGRIANRSASYTLRVPSASFNSVMAALPTLGNVPYSHTYTENVSAQYYDTQARLTAYETQEEKLLEMMELAESVEDVIAIEEKLTELRYKIESLQSSLNNWDRKVSYSYIYLNVEEVEEYTPESMVQPSYGEKLLSAMTGGLEAVGEFFSSMLLWLVGALPTLLLLGLVLWAVLRLRRARKAKKQNKTTEK